MKGSSVLWCLKKIYFIYMDVFLYATLSRSLYRPEEDRAWNSVEFQSAVNCSEWMLGTKARFSGTALKH